MNPRLPAPKAGALPDCATPRSGEPPNYTGPTQSQAGDPLNDCKPVRLAMTRTTAPGRPWQKSSRSENRGLSEGMRRLVRSPVKSRAVEIGFGEQEGAELAAGQSEEAAHAASLDRRPDAPGVPPSWLPTGHSFGHFGPRYTRNKCRLPR